LLVVAAMKMDSRFAKAVACSVEADHHKRNERKCRTPTLPLRTTDCKGLRWHPLASAA
jgi:hypothetical protein